MSRTILLADDSVTIQKVIELTFMDEDYEVVAIGNGDDALEKLDEITPDFVIADVHMPGASGYDVAKHSKSLRPEIPVLLLVGTFEPFDEELAEKSGCDAYLKKPFDSQELQRLVEDLSAEADRDLGPLEATGWQAQAQESPPEGPDDAAMAGSSQETPGLGEPSAEGPLEAESAPFSIGLEDDETPPPTQVEPPPEPPRPPEPEAVGSTAAPEPEAEEPAFDLEPSEPGATQAEPPVFEAVPEHRDAAAAEAEAPGPELPTEPEPAESAPPEPSESPAEPAASESAEAVAAVPAERSAPSGEPSAGSPLSDEDVDRIARRIVELLGDRAVRDVAWEVVPDMAEVVIRNRLQDLENQVETVE